MSYNCKFRHESTLRVKKHANQQPFITSTDGGCFSLKNSAINRLISKFAIKALSHFPAYPYTVELARETEVAFHFH